MPHLKVTTCLLLALLILSLSACTLAVQPPHQEEAANPAAPADHRDLDLPCSLVGYRISTLPPNAGLLLIGFLGLLGWLLTAWILALRNMGGRPWLWRSLIAVCTLSVIAALLWFHIQTDPGIRLGGVVYQLRGLSVEGEVVDQAAYMRSLQRDLQRYARRMEARLTPLLSDHPLLEPADWLSHLNRTSAREDSAYGYHIPLWQESGPTIFHSVACNVLPIHQISFSSISPTRSLEVPEAGIRLDWFVNTGEDALDQQILEIIESTTAGWRW